MKTMSEDHTPFKMKGNPFTTGGVQGTNSHVSALKKRKEENINELVEQRKNLREREEQLKDKKFLGNIRRKRNLKKQEKVQEKINVNPTAQEWKRKGLGAAAGIAGKLIKKGKKSYDKNIKDKRSTSTPPVDYDLIVDHPDGYSRGQESSIFDKAKKTGGKILDLLKPIGFGGSTHQEYIDKVIKKKGKQ